ncbi:O-antigen ligase family protein [Candidatus Woesebacteria bacterium]|nr:O-antigen ligase family protein [Candidatus Woesebacteria bacterium]
MKKILTWIDNNLLTLLTGFLIVMIPLYPKIPLAELIQGYIVRMRLEDLLVLFTLGVWLLQILRKKVVFPKNLIGKVMLIYLGIGFLSVLSAIYLTHSVPLEKAHILKIWLHWFRRIEYFSLFFVTYSAIRTKKDLLLLVKVALITFVGVILYGIGQKYFYWPAFSTMNREFSKGVRLYLQPNSRLLSTFGGHYDLAGYLMMLITFTLPAAWLTVKKGFKFFLYIISLVAYWCLVLTTSRTSFIGFLVGITVVALLLIKSKGWGWVLKRWLATMFVSFIIMFTFSNLLERFLQVLPNKDLREKILAVQTIVNQPFVSEPKDSQTVAELPSLLAFLFKNEPLKPIELTEGEKSQLEIVASSSDMPPSTVRPAKPSPTPTVGLPSDVTEESEQIRRDTAEEAGTVYNGPQYSANALKYGLSMGIRLDALWPQAIKGFKSNPILGSGYSTLVKTNVGEFTYAESTDNDFLRMLGETGILGTLAFLYIIYLVFKYSLSNIQNTTGSTLVLSLGAIGATVAMLVTATYIDIFESSKVAYTYWMIVALVAYLYDQKYAKEN